MPNWERPPPRMQISAEREGNPCSCLRFSLQARTDGLLLGESVGDLSPDLRETTQRGRHQLVREAQVIEF